MESTTEDRTLESCLRIVNQTPKMEGLNLSKDVSTKTQIFVEQSHRNKF